MQDDKKAREEQEEGVQGKRPSHMVQAYLAEHPGARVFMFFAGDPMPEGVRVALALHPSNQGTLRLWRGAAGARQGPGT
jgi:hypothetical protein